MILKLFLLTFVSYFIFISSFCPFHKTKQQTSSPSTSSFSSSSNLKEKNQDTSTTTTTQTPLLGQLPITQNNTDSYVQINNFFHNSYQNTQMNILPTIKILNEGDYMVLIFQNNTRLVEPFVSDIYHNLKMISHLPVTVYSILLENKTKSIQLNNDVIISLNTFQTLLNNLVITSERFSDPIQLERQKRIYDQTNDFVSSLLTSKECSLETLQSFVWSTSNDINSNLNDAAADSINLLHSVIMNWKNNILSNTEWNELYVATVGSHMSSQESLPRQYFQRLFNQTTSPQICGEYQGWDSYDTKAFQLDGGNYMYEEDLIDVVGTHYTDYPMGRDFFHSLYRMHKDALADGAKQAIDAIFGPLDTNDNDNKNGNDNNKNKSISPLFSLLAIIPIGIGIFFYIAWMKQKKSSNDAVIEDKKQVNLTPNRNLIPSDLERS